MLVSINVVLLDFYAIFLSTGFSSDSFFSDHLSFHPRFPKCISHDVSGVFGAAGVFGETVREYRFVV